VGIEMFSENSRRSKKERRY